MLCSGGPAASRSLRAKFVQPVVGELEQLSVTGLTRRTQPCEDCAQNTFGLLAASSSNSAAPAMLAIRVTNFVTLTSSSKIDSCNGIDTRFRVAQLFVVVLDGMREASVLLSQHTRLCTLSIPLPHFAERGTQP